MGTIAQCISNTFKKAMEKKKTFTSICTFRNTKYHNGVFAHIFYAPFTFERKFRHKIKIRVIFA